MNKSSTNKPYSESCEQNQDAILAVIKPLLADKKYLLEIGSGTGQHAVYFAQRMPHLIWQTSDQESYHHGIKLWLDEAKLSNTPAPIKLEVSNDAWPSLSIDAIFSANAVHIMSWQNVVDFMENAPPLLAQGGLFILYGPFNYKGKYTSESNARFDIWLKQNNPQSAIRDFEAINELAEHQGLTLLKDYTMPANNRVLCWQKN
jgi:cyclopropane fatty-acyl-phospholipid synthase-like methyltransferase